MVGERMEGADGGKGGANAIAREDKQVERKGRE
jgi:hypothetical protein